MREPDLLHTALTDRLDGIFILHYAFFILHSSKFPFILSLRTLRIFRGARKSEKKRKKHFTKKWVYCIMAV